MQSLKYSPVAARMALTMRENQKQEADGDDDGEGEQPVFDKAPNALTGFYLDAPNPVQGGLQLDEQTGRSKDQSDDLTGP
jgi:hypothetical protein